MTRRLWQTTSVKLKSFLENYVRANAVFILLIRREDHVYTVIIKETQSENIFWEDK